LIGELIRPFVRSRNAFFSERNAVRHRIDASEDGGRTDIHVQPRRRPLVEATGIAVASARSEA